MKISELIDTLEQNMFDFGDVTVHIWDQIEGADNTLPIYGIAYCKKTSKTIIMDEQDYTYTCQNEGLINKKPVLRLL